MITFIKYVPNSYFRESSTGQNTGINSWNPAYRKQEEVVTYFIERDNKQERYISISISI
jgi:hypothetical protein